MAKSSQQKGGGARKIGRNKVKCAEYRMKGIREKNKRRKVAKHKAFIAKKKAKMGAKSAA